MRPGYDDVHLVTGFPGFVARHLVTDLLAEEPRALVVLVVLARFLPAAAAVLDRLPREQRERAVVLEGDAAAIDLGLSGAEYRSLASEVDYVHHLAHAGYAGIDRKTAHDVNVGGAAEVIELGRNAQTLRSIVIHSSTTVAGDRTGVVLESDLDAGQSFRNPIEESRLRAEKIVRRAMAELPITVVRPSAVVGDSGSGRTLRFDGANLLLSLLVAAPDDFAVPLIGKGDAPFHVVPVDFVSKAARLMARHPDAHGETFHLVDPVPPTAAEVFELVARAAGKRAPSGSIPAGIARVILAAPGLERFAADPRTLAVQLIQNVRFDARRAERILHPANVHCPPFATYVDNLVEALRDHLGRAKPRAAENEGATA
jgi:thioester reductase-like protein